MHISLCVKDDFDKIPEIQIMLKMESKLVQKYLSRPMNRAWTYNARATTGHATCTIAWTSPILTGHACSWHVCMSGLHETVWEVLGSCKTWFMNCVKHMVAWTRVRMHAMGLCIIGCAPGPCTCRPMHHGSCACSPGLLMGVGWAFSYRSCSRYYLII